MTEQLPIRRVGLVFSGGPAPGANAVICAAGLAFMNVGVEVVGFFHGYSALAEYHPITHRLVPDQDYRVFQDDRELAGLRNSRGVVIGTARVNPGRGIRGPADFDDPHKTLKLRNTYAALVDLGIDALVSIGGDGTLMTANYLYEWQKRLPPEAPRVRVCHVPKTVDNDYNGIDFTFGFFTAVDLLAKSLMNLRADAIATSSYYVVETMGRSAGWVAYAVAVAGEANLVLGVEDLADDALVRVEDGKRRCCLDKLSDRVTDLVLEREAAGKHYGTIVLAEGLAEHLTADVLEGCERDAWGNVKLGKVRLGDLVATRVAAKYAARTGGRKKKLTGIQLGYEARSASPHAFDVMLGAQLGIGAYRALVEEKKDGHMVSVTGQLDLRFVPFSELIDPQTLLASVRYVRPDSDYHRLARFLEKRSERRGWVPGRRREPGEAE